jgi:hypothetical protein
MMTSRVANNIQATSPLLGNRRWGHSRPRSRCRCSSGGRDGFGLGQGQFHTAGGIPFTGGDVIGLLQHDAVFAHTGCLQGIPGGERTLLGQFLVHIGRARGVHEPRDLNLGVFVGGQEIGHRFGCGASVSAKFRLAAFKHQLGSGEIRGLNAAEHGQGQEQPQRFEVGFHDGLSSCS